jgi:hypothetical protein
LGLSISNGEPFPLHPDRREHPVHPTLPAWPLEYRPRPISVATVAPVAPRRTGLDRASFARHLISHLSNKQLRGPLPRILCRGSAFILSPGGIPGGPLAFELK